MKKASCSLMTPATFVVMLLSLIATFIVLVLLGTNLAYSQTTQSEEYKSKHDGGDREEYEQELAYNDPEFYVPPVNDTVSSPVNVNTTG